MNFPKEIDREDMRLFRMECELVGYQWKRVTDHDCVRTKFWNPRQVVWEGSAVTYQRPHNGDVWVKTWDWHRNTIREGQTTHRKEQ